ncbi:MAG: ketoacyl-ACP synthase III [Caldisericia bacterium]|nr:ketoacyl-ACP synthase III [Caldisericia bacterium]
MSFVNIRIAGWGHYAPEKVVTNQDFEKMMDTSDEWITTRSGIKRRHYANPNETSSTMGVIAGKKALLAADMQPGEVDLLIVGTSTQDMVFPSTACLIAGRLGCTAPMAFDVSAGCTGFLHALSIATQFLNAGLYTSALVIGSDTITRYTDFSDRSTAVLFGDGAGAVLITTKGASKPMVLAEIHGSDSSGADKLYLSGGGSAHPINVHSIKNHENVLYMNGKEIFKFAVKISDTILDYLFLQTGLTPDHIDHFLFHQANYRIIESAANRLHIPESKLIVTIDEYGNTSSATIPMSLSVSADSGKIVAGQKIVLVAFGAGLTWGGMVIQWNL